jgi:6-pyruvoyl-tetrahydropterin synthase
VQSVAVRHNVEMAHRLSLLPGKCENVHGHSWWVELELFGEPNKNGIILNFSDIKKAFRYFLDTNFDHHCALNGDDWLAQSLYAFMPQEGEGEDSWVKSMGELPGLVKFVGDPTTENFARVIGEWAHEFVEQWKNPITRILVTVWETSVNCATWSDEHHHEPARWETDGPT